MRRNRTRDEPSTRQLRVGEQLRHIVAEIFQRQEFRDPVLLAADLTVTEVQISPDLRNATVYILPLGGATTEELMSALGRLAPHVRHLIGQRARLRHAPRIGFAWDTVFDKADRVERLLHDPRVARDLVPDDAAAPAQSREQPDEA